MINKINNLKIHENGPSDLTLSVTSPLSSMNKYIDIIVSQNTTQFYAQYVQYISQLHVSTTLARLT